MNDNTVEFVLLPFLFLIGAPLNVHALLRYILDRKRRMTKRTSTPGEICAEDIERVLVHRNVVDLLVIFVCVPSKLALAATQQLWYVESEALCKGLCFINMFSFHASSNLIVAIAIDRLVHIVFWERLRPFQRCRPSMVILFSAWTFSAVCALPNLIFWHLRAFPLRYLLSKIYHRRIPHANVTAMNGSVCISDWEYNIHLASLLNRTSDYTVLQQSLAHGYYYFHMFSMFWGPALCIFACYGIVICYVCIRGTKVSGERQPLLVNRRLHVCRVSTLLVCLYCFSWTPYCIVALFDHSSIRQTALFYFHHLIILNSALNPLLYRIHSADQDAPVHGRVPHCSTKDNVHQAFNSQNLTKRSWRYLRGTLTLDTQARSTSPSTEFLDLSTKQAISTTSSPGYTNNVFETVN